MAYPTAASLKAASAVAALAPATGDVLEELRAAAIQAVEEFCGQSFTQRAGATHVLAGSGTDVLYLPERLVVLDVITVRTAPYDLTSVAIAGNGARLELVRPQTGGWAVQALNDALGRRSYADRVFPSLPRAIALTGTWGWSDAEWAAAAADKVHVLNRVRTALRLDMEDQALADAHQLTENVRAYRAHGVRTVAQKGMSFDLRDGSTLNPRARRLLRSLVWVGHQLGATA